SRLIFRNLPPTITPESFSKSLASPASLSDIVITDTRVNPKRRFAFAGFKSPEDAAKVQSWFDDTYVFGGGKVKVEVVRERPLEVKSFQARKPPVATDLKENVVADGKLKEFMEVMKGNGAAASSSKSPAVPGDDGWKVDGMKSKKERKARQPPQQSDDAAPSADAEVMAVDDDAEWLRQRQKTDVALDAEEVGDTQYEVPAADESDVGPDERLILSTSRLFVRNLPFVTTTSDLETHFSRFGQVDQVHLPLSPAGQPLGTAFVLFRRPEDALSAFRELDKTTFQGRLLHVLPGRARPGHEVSGVGKGDVKKGVETKRKEQSAKGVNWASLYMNSDAVAASVAQRMGISKAELLNGDDGNAAVKLALAETHVIEETKRYFEEQGIVIEALSPRTPRSQTILLIKNIPFGTSQHTLTDLFSPHGEIKRLLLPPSGTLGVVEYVNASDAGKAFKALSYRRLGNAVLYLEKGPVGMFLDKEPTTGPTVTKVTDVALELTERVENASKDAPDPSDEAGSTLFLKNLSFATTTERLISVLFAIPGYSFVRVQTKPDPKRPGERLSMGYGFVGFKTKEAASKALPGLDGFEVDGKKLEVKFAQRGVEDVQKEEKGGEMKGKSKGTKLLVKNLPFEATKKEVKELFSAYGQVKSLRVPKKPTLSASGAHSSRGFAFLEFTTHVEAQRAMDALKHTHLLGRHLVIQWAKEDDEVDVSGLREKASRDARFLTDDGGGERAKKRKVRMDATAEDMDGLEV
ncbi:hypothetical protein TREMEDRAFT_25743, partial [Tremella mesenterica DSM 1558]|uniref:uncharacterized protein n=1 Tax=Tremella mesenterica (strain ATCC 24925 / CBS 8224 / DSM 1558 / NBRC 9311 / NRRL Y-6157 / RJB 2259-6 / UBC 559-6) TaxID=578456 RepID=UPI0003F4A1E5